MDKATGIRGIGQIAVAVSDIDRAAAFYEEVLGLQLLFRAPPGMAFFQCGETRLMLTTQQGEARDHRTSVIYYRVENIQESARVLGERGVEFIREPQLAARLEDHELWIGFLRDPDDNLVGIMAEVPLDK